MGRTRQLDQAAQALNTLELTLAALRPELESLYIRSLGVHPSVLPCYH